jgi:signal transduction histidine kinase/CheY-like chemotaxis protein
LLDAVVSAARGWVVPPRRAGSAGEGEVIVPGQRPRAVEFAAVPGILPGLHLAVLRDVTERKQLHARLALADRMVSVGTLAAGVAHELNNPLAYVNANLSFLAERLARVGELLGRTPGIPAADADLSPQLLEAVRDARDGAERMRVIVRDLKTFSRADDERSGPVPLKPVIESCVNMAWSEIRHRAQLVKDLHDVPPVVANEARLGQVFLNLVVNAAQAIPEGRAEENEIRISTRVAADGRVAVEVRDTGCGIAPEHLTRVFDPFFTTKSPGVGTGLGLSICHSIVTALGGDITVESGRGGTLFRVSLPPAPADATSPVVPPSAGVRPRGRILVVDDEPLVGTVLQRTLSSEHDVTVVTTARAALEHLGAGSYDLVLSDLLMPEMSGMELYDALSRRDPALARKVVFLTGGAFTPAARAFLEREPVLCVEKPFELEAIRAVLARKLAELGD